jgi:6-phosphogluconolactonase
MARITIVDDAAQIAEVGARRVSALIAEALSQQPTASLCLTGGHTPELLYQRLATEQVDWPRVQLFWGDERHVPPDHPDSNYGMAQRALLSRIAIPSANIHRIRGELTDPHEAARLYEAEITVSLKARLQPDPLFDVMLLGVGEDAHIASIFPDVAGGKGLPRNTDLVPSGAGLHGRRQLVAAVWASHLNTWRITLTPAAILDSGAILVITAGAEKADAVHAALAAPLDVNRYPAQLVRDREWLIDRAASRRLDAPPAQSA